MPEREVGAERPPQRGKGRWHLLHSLPTGAWCGSRHRISSPASEKVAPLPYLLSQQFRKGSGVGCGSGVSEEGSSAQRNRDSRGHTANEEHGWRVARSAWLCSLLLQLLLLWPSLFARSSRSRVGEEVAPTQGLPGLSYKDMDFKFTFLKLSVCFGKSQPRILRLENTKNIL